MGNDERKRSIEELSRALRAFLSASDAFDEALGRVLGLNPTDVRCVDLLDQYGTMTAGALAGVAGLSTGAVTFLLDRLERAGFVRRVRDLDDRRRVLVELVPLRQVADSSSCTRASSRLGGSPRSTSRSPISRASSPSCEKEPGSTRHRSQSSARRSLPGTASALPTAGRPSKRR